MLLLSDAALVEHFERAGAPLPFSLSGLRKDRNIGSLGGVPFRKIGGLCRYNPGEVDAWLDGHQVIATARADAANFRRHTRPVRSGRPTKSESVEAQRRGLTVRELRARAEGAA